MQHMGWGPDGRGEAGHKGVSGMRQRSPVFGVWETVEDSFLGQVFSLLRASMCLSIKGANLKEILAGTVHNSHKVERTQVSNSR